jgi:hypothetical protein
LPDGLFVPEGDDGTLVFVPLPEPTTEDIEALTLKVARRLTAVVERFCEDECETEALLEQTAGAMRDALAGAVKPPVPDLGLPGLEPQGPAKPLCANVAGFSLHAGQVVAADDREALERLCRYGLRAPFSQERMLLDDDGRVVYLLRRPWPDGLGVTSLTLEPLELLRRLAALVPAPYTHMVRYHGIFASRSKLRSRLPAPPPPRDADSQQKSAGAPAGEGEQSATAPTETTPPTMPPLNPTSDGRRRRRMPWAELLMRVFFVDALKCPRCSSALVVLAFLSDPPVVAKILRHLGLPDTAPPLAPADPDCRRQAGSGHLFPDAARPP